GKQGFRRERRGVVLPRRGATEAGRRAPLPRHPRPQLRDRRLRGHQGLLERGARDLAGPQAARALRAVREELPAPEARPAAHGRRALRRHARDTQAQRPARGHLHPAARLQGRRIGGGQPQGPLGALYLHGPDGQLRGADRSQVLRLLLAPHPGQRHPGARQVHRLLRQHGARRGPGPQGRLRRRHLPHPGRAGLGGERREHIPRPQGRAHHAARHGGHPRGHNARRRHGARGEGARDPGRRARGGPDGALRRGRGLPLWHGLPDRARHGGRRPPHRHGQHRPRRRAPAGAVLQGRPRRLGRVRGLDRRRRGCGGGAAV
ncbi:MAG: Branched-chain amino acid aminotransferase, partial [uncultured Rubrobacteraceae bacterium]